MKNLILTLTFFVSGFVYSQGLPIMQNDWYLTELTIDGEVYLPPSNEELGSVWMKIYEEPEDFFWFETKSCDLLLGLLNWVTENAFSFFDFGGGGDCTISENIEFDQKYADFYGYGGLNGNPFNYTIYEDGNNSFVLEVMDDQGNSALYSNKTMSTTDVFSDTVKLSPNPFIDKVLLSGVHQSGLSAYIIDLQGRTVLNSIPLDSNYPEFDLSDLKQGVYLFVLKDSNNRILHKQKIIKKLER